MALYFVHHSAHVKPPTKLPTMCSDIGKSFLLFRVGYPRDGSFIEFSVRSSSVQCVKEPHVVGLQYYIHQC